MPATVAEATLRAWVALWNRTSYFPAPAVFAVPIDSGAMENIA